MTNQLVKYTCMQYAPFGRSQGMLRMDRLGQHAGDSFLNISYKDNSNAGLESASTPTMTSHLYVSDPYRLGRQLEVTSTSRNKCSREEDAPPFVPVIPTSIIHVTALHLLTDNLAISADEAFGSKGEMIDSELKPTLLYELSNEPPQRGMPHSEGEQCRLTYA